jgi:hypothetical protein
MEKNSKKIEKVQERALHFKNISFMKTLNKRGPSIDPCATPL